MQRDTEPLILGLALVQAGLRLFSDTARGSLTPTKLSLGS